MNDAMLANAPGWSMGLPVGITVCDKNGVIVDMNEKAARIFQRSGGASLIGKSLLDCHPEPARNKLNDLLRNPRTNCYTIEKQGIKKMIYQCPWYKDNEFAGLVEISLELPAEVPHFVRQG